MIAAAMPTADRNATMLRHMGLVHSIARRYEGLGLPLDDLIQEGFIGLAKAVERYEEARGFTFATFAARLIRQAVQEALKANATIRVPEGLDAMLRSLAKAEAELTQELGRRPAFEEVAEFLGLTPEQARRAMLGRAARALVRDDDDDRDGIEGAAAAETDAEEPAFADPIERIADLCEAMLRLSPAERRLMRLRLGFGDESGGRRHTLAEAGARLGVTRQRAHQIESRALGKIRPACGTM